MPCKRFRLSLRAIECSLRLRSLGGETEGGHTLMVLPGRVMDFEIQYFSAIRRQFGSRASSRNSGTSFAA